MGTVSGDTTQYVLYHRWRDRQNDQIAQVIAVWRSFRREQNWVAFEYENDGAVRALPTYQAIPLYAFMEDWE